MHSTMNFNHIRICLCLAIVLGVLLPLVSTAEVTNEDKMAKNSKAMTRAKRAFAGWSHKPATRKEIQDKIARYEEINKRANAVIMENLHSLDAMKKEFKEKADRLRRDYDMSGQTAIKDHVVKAEKESLIAGHESAVAGNHAIEAAEQAKEAEQELEGHGGVGQDQHHSQGASQHQSGTNLHQEGTVSQFSWPSGAHSDALTSGYGSSLSHLLHGGGGARDPGISASAMHSQPMHLQNLNPNPNTNSHTADVETPVQELIQQSTDLAKETRVVFEVIAAREDYLVRQMEGFKEALRGAIELIQDMARQNKMRYKRWDEAGGSPGPDGSYQACVYVTPPQRIQQEPLPQGRSAEQFIQEPSEVNEEQEQGEDFDLNSIYWLKLPENEIESSMAKVQRVLAETRENGRDILIIPVQKGFTNEADLANGFLRAVRVNPATARNSKQKRKRFRLRIRRVL